MLTSKTSSHLRFDGHGHGKNLRPDVELTAYLVVQQVEGQVDVQAVRLGTRVDDQPVIVGVHEDVRSPFHPFQQNLGD